MKVMSAIESCRTAGLGARCVLRGLPAHDHRPQQLPHPALPQVSGSRGERVDAGAEAELLPVPYFHIVFTPPSAVGDIAYQNKAAIYDLLFKASAETLLTIASSKGTAPLCLTSVACGGVLSLMIC